MNCGRLSLNKFIGVIFSVIFLTTGSFGMLKHGFSIKNEAWRRMGSPILKPFLTLGEDRYDQPKPIITTDGPIGTPVTAQLPEAYLVSGEANSLRGIQSWTNPFVEDFDSSNEINSTVWAVIDANGAKGGDVKWGIDDNPFFTYNNSPHSIWVAAAGNDKRDSEFDNYPPNLDTWMKTKNPLDLSAVQMASVEFYMYYRTEVQNDWIFVGASVDGVNFIGEYWTGWSGDFQYFNLNLSEFIGYSQVYLAWYFHSNDMSTVYDEGVWVDHISFWLYQDTGPAQPTQYIQNGDFETGNLAPWSVSTPSSVRVVEIANPKSGRYTALLGGGNSLNQRLFQKMTLDNSDITKAQLDFWINLFGNESERGADGICAGFYSGDLSTQLLDLGCLDGQEALASSFEASQWWHANYLLNAEEWQNVRGKEVALVFEMTTNGSKATTALLDDVRFEVETRISGDGEPNDTFSQATPITQGTPLVERSIDPDDDIDLYRFSALQGDLAIVDVDSATFGTPLDSYVQVLDDTDHTVLCENDDDGSTMDSFLACEIQGDGTYYLRVSSYDGHGDRNRLYNLLLELQYTGEITPTLPPTPAPIANPLPPIAQTKPWTVILYLSGDNSLCQSYEDMVARLGTKLVDSLNAFLNVVVLLDRNPLYCNGEGNATRFVVQPDNAYTENVNRWNMGEINMGDPQTLVNFARWAMKNFPAQHVYLAVAGQGGGTSGLSFDETSDGDRLTGAEIYSALKGVTENGTHKFDLISLDASLTGLFENAYDLRNYSQYILVFPTAMPSSLASYPDYLSHPSFTSSSLGLDLANIILDVFPLSVNHPFAMALIQGDKMDDVNLALQSWANSMLGQMNTVRDKITLARDSSQKVDSNGDGVLTEKDFYLDLWDLAEKMASQGLALSEGDALKVAISNAVIRSEQSSNDILDYSNVHGLTIYFPWMPSIGYSMYVKDQEYSSARSGVWDEFLEGYFADFQQLGMSIDLGVVRSPLFSYQFLPTVMKP